MESSNKKKTNNKQQIFRTIVYTTLGVGTFAWGTISTLNYLKVSKEKELLQKEWSEKEKNLVDSYDLLNERFAKSSHSEKTKIAENQELQNKNSLLESQISSALRTKEESAKQAELHKKTADSLLGELDFYVKKHQILELVIGNNNMKIDSLETEVSKMKNITSQYTSRLIGQADTVNILQKYLNIYMVSRRPINKVAEQKNHLPQENFYLPTDKETIKGIKKTNRDYRRQNK